MLDTSVAIHVRDADEAILARLERTEVPVCLSIVTMVELEGGAMRAPAHAPRRREAIDHLRDAYAVLPFTEENVAAYREIVAALGFSRPQLLDRMIAAQALVSGAMLATLNPRDFRKIPGLTIEDWTV